MKESLMGETLRGMAMAFEIYRVLEPTQVQILELLALFLLRAPPAPRPAVVSIV